MFRTFRLQLLAVGATVALAACGGGATADEGGDDPGQSAGGDGVTVSATEFEFDPADFSLPADTPTDVTLENKGVVEHDITVDELDLQIYAAGASSTTETVTAPAGTYTFYCSIPGHRDSGMEGTLTVEG